MIARQQLHGQIPTEDEEGWMELIGSYYAGSPAIRDQYERFQRGYQAGVRKLLAIDKYEARMSVDEMFGDSDGYGTTLLG